MDTPTLDEVAHRAVTIVIHTNTLDPVITFQVTAYTSAGGGRVESSVAVDASLETAIRTAMKRTEKEAVA